MTIDALGRVSFALSTILMLAAIGGCGQAPDETQSPPDSPIPATTTALAEGPPSLDELANATFTGILEEPVQLVDGSWEGEPFVEGGVSAPAAGLVRHFHLTGDLTGDGHQEAAILLWTSSGGSGTFDYLAVSGRADEGIRNLGTAEIGDRVQIRGGHVVDGKIELDLVQAGPDDAACCPTQLATRVWAMGSTGLTEVSSAITGTLSLAHLRELEWILTDFAWNEPAPAETEVTLVFEDDRVAGTAGCNGYFGGIQQADDMPSGISIGQLGTTRKMCPEEVMTIEGRFLRQLAAVTSYSYIAGRLALSWQDDQSAGVMIFGKRQ